MAVFSIAQRTTVTTIAAAAWELRSSASNRPKVMELGICLAAATASVYGVGRPAAIGITPTAPLTVQDEGDGAAAVGTTQCAVAWGTGPTVPADFLRRASLKAELGACIIWTFPRGLSIPVSASVGSIVVWNITTNSAATDIWAVVEE